MKKLISLLYIFLCLSILTSCSYEDMMDKLVPKEESKFAEEYLDKFRAKDFDYVKSLMSKETLAQANDALLIEMSNYFRKGELLSTEIIGSQVNEFNGQWQGNFSFEYHFTDGWNLANAAFKKVDGKYEVIGLNVYQTNMSQKELHAFTLQNKSILQYLILFLAIIIPAFIVVTTYYCARTPIPKRKWLWVIFILLGVFSVQVNWTTGGIGIQPLSAYLLGISAVAAGPHAPWIITTSFPLGAVIFWFKRRRFIELSKNG